MHWSIRTADDVLARLDRLFASNITWDASYADRGKPIPFFVPKPDENLALYLVRGLLAPGRALELGFGPGRNAIHLASFGFDVDAVDLSPTALAPTTWSTRRRTCAGSSLTWPKSRCAHGRAVAGLAALRRPLPSDRACSTAGQRPCPCSQPASCTQQHASQANRKTGTRGSPGSHPASWGITARLGLWYLSHGVRFE